MALGVLLPRLLSRAFRRVLRDALPAAVGLVRPRLSPAWPVGDLALGVKQRSDAV